MEIKTPSDLKYEVEKAGHDRYFFTRDTMKFFGDTMKNYGVRKTTIRVRDRGEVVAWELWRRRPVKHGLSDSAYFDPETFARLFPETP